MAINRIVSFSLALATAAFLAACGDKNIEAQSENSAEKNTQVSTLDDTAQIAAAASSAMEGASTIPYPVYPNGSKYRVGGENGLKIVLFETTDTFEQVDSFYKDLSEDAHMPRLVAMSDYVRYSSSVEDNDPWATSRPGIVIHKFNDDEERQAVGADSDALTNIIMSF